MNAPTPKPWISPFPPHTPEELAAMTERRRWSGPMLDINAMDELDPVHLRQSGFDLDKQEEIARGDDLDVTPQQYGTST